ncbi:MAG: DeoR/GlpR family DNA-binding transcription regulator [Lachnospiraceae bacterium]|nr:DeoR/GlpR family DNA-binding transcription regulator [Lachnospiraceae bacterium]
MLTVERQKLIMDIVNDSGSVTVSELMDKLNASESTIRRDLQAMDMAGKLKKVHGGAVAVVNKYKTDDAKVELRKQLNKKEKVAIAKYAASLVNDKDFVYLDAGTTTEIMIDYLKCKDVIFVTNAIEHARKLTAKGFVTYILGGEFKEITEAIVGTEALLNLDKYNFTKGFFGANGFSIDNGFTTPDIKEAIVKKKAIESSKESYVLMDSSKFEQVAAITFADYEGITIITDSRLQKKYENVLIKKVK